MANALGRPCLHAWSDDFIKKKQLWPFNEAVDCIEVQVPDSWRKGSIYAHNSTATYLHEYSMSPVCYFWLFKGFFFFFLSQVPTLTVLFISITLYAYCQPYKHRIASVMELVQLLFTVTFLPLLFPDAPMSAIELRATNPHLCQTNDVPDILTPANYIRLCFYLPVLVLIILVLWLLGRWTVWVIYTVLCHTCILVRTQTWI